MSCLKTWVERGDPARGRRAKKNKDNLNQQLVDALYEDFERVEDGLYRHPEDGLRRRTFVRTFFSLVEGMTSVLARDILWYNHNKICPLSENELDLLTEQGGFIPLKRRVLCTFSIYSQKVIGRAFDLDTVGYDINTNDPNWQDFLETIKVRNRLMHPKSVQDLRITDQQMDVLARNGKWFDRLFYRLMMAGVEVCARTVIAHIDNAPNMSGRSRAFRDELIKNLRLKKGFR